MTTHVHQRTLVFQVNTIFILVTQSDVNGSHVQSYICIYTLYIYMYIKILEITSLSERL